MLKGRIPYFITILLLALFAYNLDFSVRPSPFFFKFYGETMEGVSAILNPQEYTRIYYKHFILGNLFNFIYNCLILGLCLFLGFIAYIQGLYSKDRTYLLWSFYLLANSLFFFCGLDYNFNLNLVTQSLHLPKIENNRPWAIPAQYLVALTYLSFILSFLKLKTYDYKLYRFIIYLQIVLGILSVVSFYATKLYWYVTWLDAFIFLVLISFFGIFLRIFGLKIPQKELLMVGSFGVLFFGLIAGLMDQLSLNDNSTFFLNPFNVFSFGIMFELVFFSLALSQRTIQIQLENQELQRKYTEDLEIEISERTKEIEEKNRLIEESKILKITSDFERKIGEIEMNALRSQMNPHFVFNCLNSIKLYSLENNAEVATNYLTKFSKLIRLVLENSRTEKISLDKELETLMLYLDMEKMRFKDKVAYHIQVDNDIDQEYTEIPPLLIQPYIENAIWHGLMQKPEGGNIHLKIYQNAKYLFIEILDDGIGRKKANELKSKSANKQKSYGMKLTAERIELINQIYKAEAKVEITDLYDIEYNSLGTKVLISLKH